jgi:hypothetical protein
MLKSVNEVFYFSGPCPVIVALIKGLKGNRFPDNDGQNFVPLFVHLVHEVEHLDVRSDSEPPSQIGEGVEKRGVLPSDKNGNQISSMFSGFHDKALLPSEVSDSSALSSGAQSGGKVDDGSVRGKCIVVYPEVAEIGSVLVDRCEELSDVRDIHKDVIDGNNYVLANLTHNVD